MNGLAFEITIQSALIIAYVILTSSCVVYACLSNSTRYLHVLQLNSYQIDGYWRSLRRYTDHDLWPLFYIYSAGVVITTTFAVLVNAASPWLFLLGMVVPPFVFVFLASRLAKLRNAQKQKKPLVETQRLLRLKKTHAYICLAWSLVSTLCAMASFFVLQSVASVPIAAFVFALIGYAPFALLAVVVVSSAAFREKPEQRINQTFIDDAKRILDGRGDLIKIGITGSYGKTSAKFILGTILKQRYQVLVPPASYNTPMGIVRMVREMLTDSHQVMIAEMGARHVHEIAELCDIVHPDIGLLTSIGKQHLETFGSFENIVNTKYEIMQTLRADGIGFFPNDEAACTELYQRYGGNKVLFGLQQSGNDVWAEEIQTGAKGSTFTLCCRDGRINCTTRLLGRHNIMNILGCAAVAQALGLSLEQIASGIENVEPIEHRLQLMNPGNGVLVIDDAFNSNPMGTQMAMEVLGMFQGYRKICVTPGMVELGQSEYEENRRFGERMASVCDIVILVGEQRAKPMAEGLKGSGFSTENMHIVSNLDGATALLATMTKAGDVVLFENDLPDHYVS